jgi:hypothetical protein
MASEDAKQVRNPVIRATCNRSIDVRRKAEDMSHETRMVPTADIAAQTHEDLVVLMKVAEMSKNIGGDLHGKLWGATTTLLTTNQALLLRAKRAERVTPQDGG